MKQTRVVLGSLRDHLDQTVVVFFLQIACDERKCGFTIQFVFGIRLIGGERNRNEMLAEFEILENRTGTLAPDLFPASCQQALVVFCARHLRKDALRFEADHGNLAIAEIAFAAGERPLAREFPKLLDIKSKAVFHGHQTFMVSVDVPFAPIVLPIGGMQVCACAECFPEGARPSMCAAQASREVDVAASPN